MSPNCELIQSPLGLEVRVGQFDRVLTGLICSDYSGTNTKLSKILLNGNNICMVPYLRFSLFGDRLLNRMPSSSQEEKARWLLHDENSFIWMLTFKSWKTEGIMLYQNMKYSGFRCEFRSTTVTSSSSVSSR